MKRVLSNLFILMFVFSFFSFGCDSDGGPTDPVVDTTNDPGTSPDTTTEPDVTVEPDKVVTPPLCETGMTELSHMGTTACVTQEFADCFGYLEGPWHMTIPNFHESVDVSIIPLPEDKQNRCPADTDFLIKNLDPYKSLCLGNDMTVSYCNNDPSLCFGTSINGSIICNNHDCDINLEACGTEGCKDFTFEKD